MKKIILDHFRRWGLVVAAIFVAYFIIQAYSFHGSHSQTSSDKTVAAIEQTTNMIHGSFVFEIILALGFLLMWDLQRGLPRVLTSLPVTPRQIGRAWWLAAVALPAIALGLITGLTFLFFSGGANMATGLETCLAKWTLVALYLGAVFGALTFTSTTLPDRPPEKIRVMLPNLLFPLMLMGFFFIQIEPVSKTKSILIFSGYLILSILGWFRAERMVLNRAVSKPGIQAASKKSSPQKIPQGFGGLRYLMLRTIIQTTLIGLAITSWMVVATSFFPAGPTNAQAFASVIEGGLTPYVFFILLFAIVPVAFQLRWLRTLPISPLALAATLVFLPLISIAIVGFIVTTIAGMMMGAAVFLPAATSFLMLGVKAAIIVPLVVWRGLDTLNYLLVFLIVLSGSLVSLAISLIFHLGKMPENPWWVTLMIFFLCAAASLVVTCQLLTKSSSVYRVRPPLASSWSMMRR